jgi:MarR family transcriptional regulator, temperature-dependent positive regulator of motility
MTVSNGSSEDVPFDLVSNVNYLLRRAHGRADALFAEAMLGVGITPRQAALLHAVGQADGSSVSDLTRVTGMDRGTLSDMIPRLVARGLLKESRSKSDGRAKALALTKSGADAVAEVARRTATLQAEVLSTLPEEYHALFIKMLSLMVGLETEVRDRSHDNGTTHHGPRKLRTTT